jgi:hypothetical protein
MRRKASRTVVVLPHRTRVPPGDDGVELMSNPDQGDQVGVRLAVGQRVEINGGELGD